MTASTQDEPQRLDATGFADGDAPPHGDAALELRDVVKQFGSKRAVDGLTLSVQRGQLLALLGPNGAGKTTTIDMCEGFQRPTSGFIRVLGVDPATHPEALRARIGIMLQGGGAYSGIKVREMLKLAASYHANPLDPEWLLDLVGLREAAGTTYRRLSGGQQQRLSLALALVGRPELVFLDEPTAGLDAQARLAVWEIIAELRRDGVTVVLTTHLLDEAESLADTVVIIDHGRAVAAGTPAELTRAPHDQIIVETASAADAAQLEATVGHRVVGTRPLRYTVEAAPTPSLIAELTAELARQDVLIRSIDVAQRSLEDVFLDITHQHARS
ncbi:ATP-binding cassette domain-containing protein [Corynebacterium uberis]|uniref:ABC transporter ATP-binding protein n=1 Tax=Corynebacterium uberis TaxID=2883169 RepID=UPI0037DD017B